jgi:hypothetical protein
MKIVALGTSQFLVSCARGLNESGCFVQEIISSLSNYFQIPQLILKISLLKLALGTLKLRALILNRRNSILHDYRPNIFKGNLNS